MTSKPSKDFIVIRNARQHNLKGIDLDIPRNQLVVITGPSGSGKSSLAFDTIYAEGQRRYVESLSTYARQFLDLMEKPAVDRIDGLSPSVAIQQYGHTRTPRSTVAATTEIYDHLRLLFARVGVPHSPHTGLPLDRHTVQQIVDAVLAYPDGDRIQIFAPLVLDQKGSHHDVLEKLRKEGYVRVRLDGDVFSLDDNITMDRNKKHTIEAVVDRLVVGPKIARRLADSLETALALTGNRVTIEIPGSREDTYTTSFICPETGIEYADPKPKLFSFNSPVGACLSCGGIGTRLEVDANRVIPNPEKSIAEGAVEPWGVPKGKQIAGQLQRFAQHFGFELTTPWKLLPESAQTTILHGSCDPDLTFDGIIPELQKRYQEATSDDARSKVERFMVPRMCADCSGTRLRPEALAVKIEGRSIADVVACSIEEAGEFINAIRLPNPLSEVLQPLLDEIRNRLTFLMDVGVGYLTLDRNASTLSGGEAQRIRLATQIGSRLVGVIYVLDEPSIGLHPRDNRRLIDSLCELRDLGNTVLVVEHDMDAMEEADFLIDLGPGAGEMGGHLVAKGTPQQIKAAEDSITGAYLSGRKSIPIPPEPRSSSSTINIKGASGHNLKSLDVDIPLGVFVCVTGVSGSGKSTLINSTLFPLLSQKLHGSHQEPLAYESITGLENVDKVIQIDQTPLGRTPRSNAATYTGLYGSIRDLYTQLPESKIRGYNAGRFSFNIKGGRCEVCRGEGVQRLEMNFLPDVYVTCESCNGQRYNRETLEVKFKGRSIADILRLTVSEALVFFRDIPQAQQKLRTMSDVGLGYLQLGQPATALSGGEAQRVKLASELSRMSTGNTLYILDEPTTGLHFQDIQILLNVLDRLVDKGNTVLVIEHNLDVIKRADWIIDLGPEGGHEGGELVAQGTPDQIVQEPLSYTGQFLQKVLSP